MLGAHYSEEIMDELVDKMLDFLENHRISDLLDLVSDAIGMEEDR